MAARELLDKAAELLIRELDDPILATFLDSVGETYKSMGAYV